MSSLPRPSPNPDESRRYRILEVVGEGGFGKVYRARLEGAEGFAKDVAIKLLTDRNAPESVLERFRDESRILGLVRDRAVITVDPPTRLEGRWAVVMEFVDGVDCRRLLKTGAIPPRTALEVVQEVARALDHVYHQPGPDGQPLRLVHRDLKPGNIQITPAGTVKVLDFGIARADFEAREAKTTTHIGGTFGYIAPERLEGEDGPESDVFSLGVVLAALVVGRRPTPKTREKIEAWVAGDPDLVSVWGLATAMQAPDPAKRPTARQVEDRCEEMARTLRGPPLRRWAEDNVVASPAFEGEDQLIGNVLTETMANVPRLTATSEIALTTTSRARTGFTVVLGLALIAALLLFAVVVAGAGGFYIAGGGGEPVNKGTNPEPAAANTVPTPVQEPSPKPEAEPSPEPPPVPAEPEEPVPTQPTTPPPAPLPVQPAAPPRPTPQPTPTPTPAPVAPVAPKPTFPITIRASPLGAEIYVDGVQRKSNRAVVSLTEGTHRILVRYTSDGAEATRKITVGPGAPTGYKLENKKTWVQSF